MSQVIGSGALLAIAQEVTWGTGVEPATHYLGVELNRSTLREFRERRIVGNLGTYADGQVGHGPARSVQVAATAGGEIEWIPHYGGYATALMFLHALGAVATSGAGPFDHDFSLDHDAIVGMTIQQKYGQHASLSRVKRFDGCIVEYLEIAIAAGEPVICKAGIIAQQAQALDALSGTPSFASADEEVLSHHGGQLVWNGDTHAIDNLTVRFNRNLTRRPIVGSLYTAKPTPAGLSSCIVSGRLQWTANDLHDDFRAQTQADGVLTFNGSGNNQLVINLNNLIFSDVGNTIETPGGLAFDFTGECFANPTQQELAITMTNDNSGALS